MPPPAPTPQELRLAALLHEAKVECWGDVCLQWHPEQARALIALGVLPPRKPDAGHLPPGHPDHSDMYLDSCPSLASLDWQDARRLPPLISTRNATLTDADVPHDC